MADEEKKVYGLGFDDEIDDGQNRQFDEIYVFEPGDYEFTVKNIDRTVNDDGYNRVIVDLEVTDGEHTSVVKDFITLKSTVIWKIAAYFRSLGMKKHGENIKMDWKGSIGKNGTLTLLKEERVSKKNTKYVINTVRTYLDPIDTVEDVEW